MATCDHNLEPPSKKRKNNTNSTPINDIIFHQDALIEILSYSNSKFILQSAMLVSKQWKEACSLVKLTFHFTGMECLVDDDDDEEEDQDVHNLKTFCQCPNIANTTSLALECCEMDGNSIKRIAESKFLHNLEHLHLNECTTLGSEEISHLVSDDSCLTKLKTLHLQKGEIGVEGAELLANSSLMSNLTSLDLYSNMIGNEGFGHIAKSKYLKHLTNLELENNEIDEEGIKLFCSSENFRELKILSLECTPDGLKILKKASFPKLESLRLLNLEFEEPEECSSLLDWPLLAQLKKFSWNCWSGVQDEQFQTLLSNKYPNLTFE